MVLYPRFPCVSSGGCCPKPVVIRFPRLRVRAMANAGPVIRTKVVSVTATTSFSISDVSFNDFCRVAPGVAVPAEDLDGFF